MKLINPTHEFINQKPGLEGIYEQIEIAGRNCYKSEKNEKQSSEAFVQKLINSKHLSVLEHGTVYLTIAFPRKAWVRGVVDKYYNNKYSIVTNNFEGDDDVYYVTTNYRVIIENGWQEDLKYLTEPTEYHHLRICVRLTTDQGVLREITRHRVFSYAVESTRYCNYSRDKFDNSITFIKPAWSYNCDSSVLYEYYDYLTNAEDSYMNLIHQGWTPQQARVVLPLATKCDIIMTGFSTDWEHFFDLRSSTASTGKPHPDMIALVDPLYKEYKERFYRFNIE